MPLQHVAEQSLSLSWLHLAAQQPSPLVHVETGAWEHAAEHDAALPVSVSMVQALPSLHEVGQLPSQASPGSTTPLPHVAEQSLSSACVQPGGQQPSPPWQLVMAAWQTLGGTARRRADQRVGRAGVAVVAAHRTVAVAGFAGLDLPVAAGRRAVAIVVVVTAGRAAAVVALTAGDGRCGRRPSLQVSAVPVSVSTVHESPSPHCVGQAWAALAVSHVSPGSTLPLPQVWMRGLVPRQEATKPMKATSTKRFEARMELPVVWGLATRNSKAHTNTHTRDHRASPSPSLTRTSACAGTGARRARKKLLRGIRGRRHEGISAHDPARARRRRCACPAARRRSRVGFFWL